MASLLLIPIVLALSAPTVARAAEPAKPDTMTFRPVDTDATADTMLFSPWAGAEEGAGLHVEVSLGGRDEGSWLRPGFGDNLITPVEAWLERDPLDGAGRSDAGLDYNRVDLLRLSAKYEAQAPRTMLPRIGGRVELATGRKRWLYGIQLEQPLAPPARLVAGVSMVRVTDHNDLQQVDDLENSLAMLLGRQDYRDYFEREGFGAYIAWRVPDFSTLSVHVRNDDYRSLGLNRAVRSWWHMERALRDNPAIDAGEAHTALLRLERLATGPKRGRSGLYHWAEVERAGGSMGGDFDYTRALADVRSVLRLSPAVTLALRGVAGSTWSGELPRQKSFTLGGVDGLRAHAFGRYRGDQLALAQAEYSIGLWTLRTSSFDGGLHAIVFVDAGKAWSNPRHRWDVEQQVIETDAGFGLATAEDNLRVYFAKDLRRIDSDLAISVRLQRPF